MTGSWEVPAEAQRAASQPLQDLTIARQNVTPGFDGGEMTEVEHPPRGVDLSRPSPARLYDYYLGGKNNFQVDRDAAKKILNTVPELPDIAWSNRGFHQRAARWIAEQGITQFIDVGAGLPTIGNTHDVVRRVTPDARIVYMDNDPMVLAHAKALMAITGNTRVITADVRRPDDVLSEPELHELIDFSEPVGFLATGVIPYVADDADPWGLLTRYLSALAPGSYLALSHITADKNPPHSVQAFLDVYANATEKCCLRSKAEVEQFFDGLELVPPYEGAEPGVCYAGVWGAEDPELADSEGSRWLWCGVARHP